MTFWSTLRTPIQCRFKHVLTVLKCISEFGGHNNKINRYDLIIVNTNLLTKNNGIEIQNSDWQRYPNLGKAISQMTFPTHEICLYDSLLSIKVLLLLFLDFSLVEIGKFASVKSQPCFCDFLFLEIR